MNKTLITTLTHFFLAATLAASSASAAQSTSDQTRTEMTYSETSADAYESSRMTHRLNIAGGILMDQLAILGVTVGYNAADFVRVRASVGTIGIGSSISAGAKFMVPGWNVTPTLGFDLPYISGTMNMGPLGSFQFGGIVPTLSLGVEWTSNGGFFMQGGLAVLPQNFSAGAVPFLGLGASI